MRKLDTVVTAAQDGRRVRDILKERFDFAESLLSHLKFLPGSVLKNGRNTRLADRAAEGDRLTVLIPGGGKAAVDFPLPVVYEDEDLLILNKPAGMTVHGAAGGRETVESLWKEYHGDRPFHPVNRLDRGTGGLMVAAKSGFVHNALRKMLHTADFRREYLAVVSGIVQPECGVIDLPLDRAEGKSFVSESGKAALTHYEAVAAGEQCTLLRLRLETGRTHQIRAHCAHLGHPLLGDTLYGGESCILTRPALHAAKIVMRQPVTGERIVAEAPLPEDMRLLFREKNIKLGSMK